MVDQSGDGSLATRIISLEAGLRDMSSLMADKKWNELKEKSGEVRLQISQIENDPSLTSLSLEEGQTVRERLNAATVRVNTVLEIITSGPPVPISGARETVENEDDLQTQPIQLPTYSGDPRMWKSFWEQFTICVDSRAKSDVSKINKLLSVLKGSAKAAVEGYCPIAQNYPVVVNVLKERFGNPGRLTSAYYEELADLKPSDDAEGQRNNLDAIQKILSNLAGLSSPMDQNSLKDSIMKKFSRSTLKDTIRAMGVISVDQFDVEDLMKALTKTVQIQEFVELHTSKRVKDRVPHQSDFKKKGTAAALVGAAPKSHCIFCDGNHPSQDCRKYGSLNARKARAAFYRLCFECMRPGHRASECNRKRDRCSHCRKTGHHISMCIGYMKTPKTGRDDRRGTYLQTFTCKCKSPVGDVELRGLLDTGSQYSYIKNDAALRLKLNVSNPTDVSVCAFGSSEPTIIRSGETLVNFEFKNSVIRSFRLLTSPYITGAAETLPPLDMVEQYLPSHLAYADNDLFKENRRDIDILIGNDLYYEFISGEIKKLPCNITLVNSVFGWIPSGVISNACVQKVQTCSSAINSDDTSSKKEAISENSSVDPSMLTNLWSLEALGIKSPQTEENDDLVLQKFRETVRFENGRYVVRWPWKLENPRIPSNFRMCMARLRSMMERTPKNTLNECDKILKDQVSLGIVEIAPRNSPFLTHYLPMKPVMKSEKIRLVYDASAKTKTGHSLNSLLYRGPVLLEDLVGLLLNFRLRKIGLIADIEKAFLQMELNEVDRDSVRFLWVKNWNIPPIPENLIHYRFKRVPFGVISSPFLLSIVLQELLTSPPINEWLLMSKRSFYVDNLVISTKDVSSAISLYESLMARFRSAGFNLRGWTSNNEDFCKYVDQTEAILFDPPTISVLGMIWNRSTDTLSVKLDENFDIGAPMCTKRKILSFVASIYDPLGLVSPCVLDLKLLVQQCWKNQIKWDSPLPTDLLAKWLKLSTEAKLITSIAIPRTYWQFTDEGIYNLHIFCDASKKAYACCAYITYSHPQFGKYGSALVFSKVRLAPIKQVTIPRLELLGVLIGKRTFMFLCAKLNMVFKETVLWTDSTTVLQWLQSASVLPQFVQNRISEIRQAPNLTFRFVPSENNPADIASRGIKADFLKSNTLWWNGPSWLGHKNLWPAMPPCTEVFNTSTVVLATSVEKYTGILDERLEKRFPSWNSYIRIFAHILRFGSKRVSTQQLSDVEKFKMAENFLIKEIQKKYFLVELAKLRKQVQPNAQLELFLHEDGLIRCKGRLQNVAFPWDTIHPILLPRDCPLTKAYVRGIHIANHHIGCNHLLAKIRERFWIIKGRAFVKSILHKCVTCRLWEGGSYKLPPLPPLPLIRVAEASPFLHTGLDYLGPLVIATETGVSVKVYVCLFVCLVTRAIHLELMRDLSADEFLMGFTRFVSRRGVPKFIISDNATNFVFVQPLVGQKVVKTSDYKLNLFLSSNNIKWKFIPQYAPWYGGAYERLVSLVKRSLKKSYGKILLDYVELNTALCNIEDVINSRPLTFVGEEVLQPLTPNHFLRLRTVNVVDSLEITPLPSTREHLLEAFGHVRGAVMAFWDAFRSLYLLSLRERHTSVHMPKKGEHSYTPKVGDVVLVKEPTAPRSEWKYGVIKKLDKRQALAHVFSDKQLITRAINQLFPLELSIKPPTLDNQDAQASTSQST